MEKNPDIKNTNSNLMAALSYVWIMCLYVLITKRNDEFVKFHVKQSVILFILSIIALALAPVLYFFCAIIWIPVVLLEILGFVKALTGERYRIPVIGHLAEKI